MLTIGISSYADTKYIHYWIVGTSAGWRTGIFLSNVCDNQDVNVTLKFWTNDGNLLASKQISSDIQTDENGEIKILINSLQTKRLEFHYNYFTFNYGHGVVKSYTKTGDNCLVGGYVNSTTKVGATNPYGLGNSYLFNNGNKF